MSPILLALLPNAIMMGIGALSGKHFSKELWNNIDKLNFQLLFPVLIFYSTASRKPYADDVLIIGTGALCITILGCLLAFPLRKLSKSPATLLDFAAVWQTSWRFNAAIAIIVVQAIPEQSRGLMSIAIGFAVPLANILAVLALSHGQSLSIKETVKSIICNPFLIASIAGLLASNIDFNIILDKTLQSLAHSATPLALLSIGASIHLKVLAKIDLFSLCLNGIKLIVLPGIALMFCFMFNLNHDKTIVLTLFAALPTASSAHLLANAFGADSQSVSTIIAQSTLLACISLPLWLNAMII